MPVLTWPRGKWQRAAARCAGRYPCSAARGKLRAQPGWRSRGSCPSTGAASRLQGSREGPPQQPGRPFLCRAGWGEAWARGLGTRQEEQDQRTAGGERGQSPGPEWDWTQRKQLTPNHDIVPAVVVAEVEVATRGSVASGHQGHVQEASLQDPHRPHSQEAQH